MADMSTRPSVVAWLALVLAAAALVVGWVAFSRTDTGRRSGLEEQADTDTQADSADDQAVQVTAARITAETRLAALRGRLVAQEGYEDALRETQQTRAELADVYATASAQAQVEWAELEPEFDVLEVQLREGSAEALEALDRLVLRLQADVEQDTENEM